MDVYGNGIFPVSLEHVATWLVATTTDKESKIFIGLILGKKNITSPHPDINFKVVRCHGDYFRFVISTFSMIYYNNVLECCLCFLNLRSLFSSTTLRWKLVNTGSYSLSLSPKRSVI